MSTRTSQNCAPRAAFDQRPSRRNLDITRAGRASLPQAVGADRYALLVARELRYGRTRFQDIAAGTGAPRDVLIARLRKLELAGVIERRRYCEHPPRYEYLLTEAGKELQPILLALKEWGDRHCNPGAEPIVFQHTCGADFHPLTVCAACREPLRTANSS